MSSVFEHRAWMEREVARQRKELNGMIAELDGYNDVLNGLRSMDYISSGYLGMRYALGWDNGKAKLMMEESCDVNR